MRAEFLQDDLENVWFSYASNICYRKAGNKMGGVIDIEADEAKETQL